MAEFAPPVEPDFVTEERRAAIDEANAQLEAEFPGLKAEYEAARANGAPDDTVRDVRARAASPLWTERERGERAARVRDSL